jgi:NAD+ synthase (glutamine-hydrolysing)
VADASRNAERTIALARRAAEDGAVLAVFPELGLSAYTNEDLFHQDALLRASLAALRQVVDASQSLDTVLVVGLPLVADAKLFNCAAVVHRGRVLGLTPKRYIPNYREFYEKRQFTSGRDASRDHVTLFSERVPFGSDLVYEAEQLPGFSLHVEICEDLWVPIPPSTTAALAGATILANLSASNVTVAKAEYRRALCNGQSAKCVAAYLYAAAGAGESTTDLAWDGHAMVWENGELLGESERFSANEQVVLADVDLDRLRQDRLRLTSFNDQAGEQQREGATIRRIPLPITAPTGVRGLRRLVARFPYVPADTAARDLRCREVYQIQVEGLTQRLSATGLGNVVIGVSGGIDSTQALLVAVKAMERLGHPHTHVLAYTMPGFGTGTRSRELAHALMESLGVTTREIDIRPSSEQMLRDIGHPAGRGEHVHDVTFENVQAGERTSHLFRLANLHDALVVGTGDLSEIALGWSTYGVGDQMSHYNVNASVPKTLIQHLIRWVIATRQFAGGTGQVLQQIVDAEISPELVPAADGNGQRSEDVVGPYELQDFFLYWVSRFGYAPSKVAFLARHAWEDVTRGSWPDLLPEARRNCYDLQRIVHWLDVFLDRFFRQSQFKRSAMPNGPKVGSGGSLSPRGDWRAPSDASSAAWRDELRRNVPIG